jgi:ubiquinone/menaquinone biosynthesis C-methylase UbiE
VSFLLDLRTVLSVAEDTKGRMTREPNNAVALQRKYYTETAARYEEMHEHEGSSDPLRMDFIVAMLRMLCVRTVLDVGTASGRTLRTLKTAIPELFICGIEPVGALVDEAVARGNSASGAILQGKGDALPFSDSSFDAVCEFAILHHVADPRIVVAEMLRVAKRAVILSDCNRFGQGQMFLRLVKFALYKTRLWGLFTYLRTSGKGYQLSKGDGLAYSYSVYDSFDQVAQWADRVFVIPADKNKPTSWLHPLLTSGELILCAIRER